MASGAVGKGAVVPIVLPIPSKLGEQRDCPQGSGCSLAKGTNQRWEAGVHRDPSRPEVPGLRALAPFPGHLQPDRPSAPAGLTASQRRSLSLKRRVLSEQTDR